MEAEQQRFVDEMGSGGRLRAFIFKLRVGLVFRNVWRAEPAAGGAQGLTAIDALLASEVEVPALVPADVRRAAT